MQKMVYFQGFNMRHPMPNLCRELIDMYRPYRHADMTKFDTIFSFPYMSLPRIKIKMGDFSSPGSMLRLIEEEITNPFKKEIEDA